jgi:aminopeptidase N
MKLSSFLKVFVAFQLSFLALYSSAQDSTICYLRDEIGRIREHNTDFTKMILDVKFDTKAGKVFGNVKYTFKPIQFVVDTIFLNAPSIDIKKVLFKGKETPFTTNKEGLTIKFLQAVDWNKEYKLEISYEATPRKGLYFVGWNVTGANTEKDNYFTRKQIWTQGQGTDNRYWIPCYDDVNDKMVTETTITFDSSYTVISNGTLKEKKKNTDGSYSWHYAMNKPMVPYLIMIAVDKFAYKDYKSKNGLISRQYYYADKPETVIPTYSYSAEMMDWLVKETGVAYPWPTYCNVPVQDFMYGAMENTTATVYGDFYLCDSRTVLERGYTGTNAHELTHQWFGDYITEYSAQHHWLHESFATYYSKQFLHSVYGEDYYQWAKRGESNQAINADRENRFPVAHSTGGSARHYPKGSFVIDMIRYVVGDSVYKRCITNYLKKHAYSNVSNHDFMYAFMETAGVNLDWFFDEWVYRSGFPNYQVSYTRQNGNAIFYVNQLQKTDNLTSYFKMPLVFEVHFKDGSSSIKKAWLSHANDTVYVTAPDDKEIDFTLFDPSGNVIKTVDFKKSYEELCAQAERAQNMIDRYDALVALREFEVEKKRDLLLKLYNKETFTQLKGEVIIQLANDKSAAALSLFKNALHDQDFLIRRAVIDNLSEIPESLLPDAERLLTDSSYNTIENTLKKLCKLYPTNSAKYFAATKGVRGINDNVLFTWLELNAKAAQQENTSFAKQLVPYTSNQYEFRTRVKAMDALERLGYCDENLIKNLFDACLYNNNRLSNPASRTLKSLLKKDNNLEVAKGISALGTWLDWQKEILEKQLK